MKYLHFGEVEHSTYPICILVPMIQREEIQKHYLEPFDVPGEDVLVMDLHYSPTSKKTPKAEMLRYIVEELQPVFEDLQVQYLLVTDGEYFKTLTGVAKVDPNIGYVLNNLHGPQKVIYLPNHVSIFYDPERVRTKIAAGMKALLSHVEGTYQPPGHEVIGFEAYPETVEEIKAWLEKLIQLDKPLACDIETFSLKHHTAGIGTIAFAWSKHEGVAFAVDLGPNGKEVRALLKDFFIRFRHTIRWHNISFDVYVLIYQLFMVHILDTRGLLEGINVLLKNWDCTKLITYLATNSCAGNKLSLKDQSQEFAGNYAMGEDIKDIRRIPLPKLLRYNLVDCLSTNYVYEKHWATLVNDGQLEIYQALFKPSTVDIIQMQLTGMPLSRKRTREVRWILYRDRRATLKRIMTAPVVQRFTHQLNVAWVAEKNATWKKKRTTLSEAREVFNPNSDPQLRALLYDMLGLPEIDFTDSGLPSTGGKTLEKLINHTEDPSIQVFLRAMIDFGTVDKLLSSFIPAMLGAVKGPDRHHYLFGNFNLGGTLSGRLSSSDPNLQNLPTGAEGEKTLKGRYGKLIKSCFQAPPGFIFCGLDFASLEDRISALTTKDPNKLKVYTDGYDGHSLRAYTYWSEKMPDIDPNSVESINSIADRKEYKPLRARGKNPTFAMTYQAKHGTLMNNYGFGEAEAYKLWSSYQELYKVSVQWVEAKLKEAAKTGYVTAAFGLRVRTPLLKQVIRGARATPYEAEAEGRSAGNALGQSWCLLNSRACNEFMGKVRTSEFRYDIRPCAQIHDAQYYLMPDDLAALAYTNEHLVKAVQWQDHPDIAHPEVTLGGEVSIFWPSWAEEIVIPNGATETQMVAKIDAAVAKHNEGASHVRA